MVRDRDPPNEEDVTRVEPVITAPLSEKSPSADDDRSPSILYSQQDKAAKIFE